MTSLPNSTQFWLDLLMFPVDMQQRTRVWNGYLAWKLPKDFLHEIQNIGNPPFNQYQPGKRLQLGREEQHALNALADKHGGHPSFSEVSTSLPARIMDFSGHTFDDEVCFAGRILLSANFCRATFNHSTDFRNTVFVNTADFEEANFRKRTRFDGTSFENTVYFKKATFVELTVFNKSQFKAAAYFDGSKFLPSKGIEGNSVGGVGFQNAVFTRGVSFADAKLDVRANFEEANFQEDANFKDTQFAETTSFQRAVLDCVTDFTSAEFKREIHFHDASFESTTYFRDCVFLQPPQFFGTDLHEDTDFSGIKWRKAESFYATSWWSKIASRFSQDDSEPDVVEASSAIQAWDRLALIMSKLEKLPERHEFYRLRMRAQRKHDRWQVLTLANWLFEMLCDYGWSIGRALASWIIHIVGMGIIIFGHTDSKDRESLEVLGDSLLVSFSNAHAFFGLTSEGAYLFEVRQRLVSGVHDESVLSTVGVIQTFIGPILLFLLLLTVRNRFRLR